MTILDSSIWVAFLNKNDSCHEKAINVLLNLNDTEVEIYDHIYAEVLNVLRSKTSERICHEFIRFLQTYYLEITISDEHILSIANNFFFQYTKLSFSDCMIVAAALLSNSSLITFDKNLQKAWNKINPYSHAQSQNLR